LPPELIVAILSHTPASSIPQLYQTNHFFKLHIDIYKRQVIKVRYSRYPSFFLSAYSTIHSTDFAQLHTLPNAWSILSKFEQKADTAISLQTLLFSSPRLSPTLAQRFYKVFLFQWESRQNMFFPKEQWQEALLDRFHIYEDCSLSEICDIIHLQMIYRNLLSTLPWPIILPSESHNPRIHWSFKSEMYRNLVDQIIGCGPEFILYLLSQSTDVVVILLRNCISESKREKNIRYTCFDDVMAKLLTRLDGGNQLATRWQEEQSYFDICASTNWFCDGDLRISPFNNRGL
jgi:hypothetical protein